MRIGLFGGSFDPVHRGHLLLAECCLHQAKLDRVEFMPAAQQPLKPRGPVASDEDRVAMLRLAIADQPAFGVSLIELERGGVSYTAETLRQLRSRRPGDEFYFLMGADSLNDLPTWREPQVICELAMPVVVRRADSPSPNFDALAPIVSAERLAKIRSLEVEMPPTPISSSEIRRLVRAGAAWESLVSDEVGEYIRQRRLYLD